MSAVEVVGAETVGMLIRRAGMEAFGGRIVQLEGGFGSRARRPVCDTKKESQTAANDGGG